MLNLRKMNLESTIEKVIFLPVKEEKKKYAFNINFEILAGY